MLKKVESYCLEHQLLQHGTGILVACSGGPDSLALFEFFRHYQKKYQLRLMVAHFEHGIRGEESVADANYVQAFCQARHIPCVVGQAAIKQLASVSNKSLELMARERRYAFLEQVRKENDLDFLAVAHHADDQAETVLMRILRGTGLTGLKAMQPCSGEANHIIRPLLCVTKAEILDWCQQNNLQPRHDSTNDIPDCTRNKLRLNVMPQLKQDFNPELTNALCQLAVMAAEDDSYLEKETDKYWEQVVVDKGQLAINNANLQVVPTAIQRRLLRRLWQMVTGANLDLSFEQTEAMRKLSAANITGSKHDLPHGYIAKVDYGNLSIVTKAAPKPATQLTPVRLNIPGETSWGKYRCQAKWCQLVDLPSQTQANEYYLQLSLDEAARLVLRTREAGDNMTLRVGKRKLKNILIDDKIPQAERATLPLVAIDSEVLWIVGRRRSSRYPLVDKNKKILYLKIIRDSKERGTLS